MINGKELALTSMEYTISECLMERLRQVVDVEEFAENREYIETVWGRGYKIG